MGQILSAGEEPQERSALLRHVVADRALQHRISRLEFIEHRTDRNLTLNLELHLFVNLRQRSQMIREHDSDHFST
jgi:hypothetical protein